jgi:hypothetical protein
MSEEQAKAGWENAQNAMTEEEPAETTTEKVLG